jgi:peptide/nickel transport system ATP-binding protein
MYAGEIVEQGPVARLFSRPSHPYTRGLLECIPVPGRLTPGERLGTIPGVVSPPIGKLEGCQFRNRCGHAEETCATRHFELRELGGGQLLRCRLDAEPEAAA